MSFEINFDSLLRLNREIVGRIAIENTAVSYPVLQTSDNEKYLTTGYNNVIKTMLEWSQIDTGATPDSSCKIVTLCTCTSDAAESATHRNVVHGRLVD